MFPTLEKSACGHSLTLTKPLRFIEIEERFKLDDGTPTDCIFLALHKLYNSNYKPDLVISGINRGSNMGEDITYSGTASACMEGSLQGVPAIAISQGCKDYWKNIDITRNIKPSKMGQFKPPRRRKNLKGKIFHFPK